MFAVPLNFTLARSLLSIPAVKAMAILGRAVHVESAMRAVRIVLPALPAWRAIRYASACSGVDLIGAALERLAPGRWYYAFASEMKAEVATALVAAWPDLSIEDVRDDARAAEATVDAPEVDLWVFTPPCEAYSRRNHKRSVAGVLSAATDLELMLAYPRALRPRAIVVENVDEPEARVAISAALLGIRDYEWQTFLSAASEYGPMERERRFWAGVRRE